MNRANQHRRAPHWDRARYNRTVHQVGRLGTDPDMLPGARHRTRRLDGWRSFAAIVLILALVTMLVATPFIITHLTN